MREILLTSSVLILALLALRSLFRERSSRRVQYALWGLAGLRRLVPFSLPAAEHSLLTATTPVGQTVTARLNQPQFYIPIDREPLGGQHPPAPDLAP